ncbi:DUF2179 domain-containing protein [Christiangramia marina]|uniref:DUF2179 domain-containing protein n=1 Tax=Christiangramia marina TaxID=409436 RepID=UPI003AA8F64B
MQIALLKNIGQGLTISNGSKGYGSQGEKQDLKIIHTVVNRIDTKKAYRILNEVDKDAFVIEFDVNRVSGGVLRKYLTRSKQRELSPTLFRNNEIDI